MRSHDMAQGPCHAHGPAAVFASSTSEAAERDKPAVAASRRLVSSDSSSEPTREPLLASQRLIRSIDARLAIPMSLTIRLVRCRTASLMESRRWPIGMILSSLPIMQHPARMNAAATRSTLPTTYFRGNITAYGYTRTRKHKHMDTNVCTGGLEAKMSVDEATRARCIHPFFGKQHSHVSQSATVDPDGAEPRWRRHTEARKA